MKNAKQTVGELEEKLRKNLPVLNQKFGYWVLMALSVFCVFQALYDSIQYVRDSYHLEHSALNNGRLEVDQAALAIGRLIHGFRKTASDLADEINTGEVRQREILKRLQEALTFEPKLFGAGVVFHPMMADREARRKTPMYASRERMGAVNSDELLEVAEFPLFQTDPQGNRITVGKVWFDVTKRLVQSEFDAVGLARRGFSFLLSREGRYLIHPQHELVVNGQTIFELAVEHDTPGLIDLGKAVIQGKPAFVDLQSGKSGQSLLAFSAPVPSTGWSVGAAYLKQPLLHPTPEMRRGVYRVIIAVCFLLLFFTAFRLTKTSMDLDSDGWMVSILSSLTLGLGIGAIWWFTLQFGEYLERAETPVHESSVLARFENEFRASCRLAERPEPLFVPTGLYIQAVEFQSAINVKQTGYVWQRWPATFPEDIEPGIVFPEAQEVSLEKVYESIEGNQKTIGWTFQVVVRQSFSYVTYPFDLQSVWLRMWPKQMNGPVVLVPDFQSYQSMNPQFNPGINKELVLPGWITSSSYFSFTPFHANTDFGLASRRAGSVPPELRYNVIIRREFFDAFVSCILPIFVVLILMFAVLFIHTKDEGIAALVGFSSSVTVQVAAALFFVVLFAQVDLRRRLEIEQLMYMDFYYFLTYLVFLFVSIDSIAFGWSNRISWLQFRENIVPKLLYWPSVMFTLFLVTVWFFFP